LSIGLDQCGSQPKKNEQATNVGESGDDDAGRHVCGITHDVELEGRVWPDNTPLATVKFCDVMIWKPLFLFDLALCVLSF
jgi:hypothetical protein